MRLLAMALLVLAGNAKASGFFFGDNGTKSLLQGGAFVAQADDVTAFVLNPAGLAQLDGLHFAFDSQFMSQQVTFLRQDPGFDPANPSTLINSVSNKGGLFYLPLLGISYGFPIAGRTFTVAVAADAPPSVGRYDFGANYTTDAAGHFVETPKKFAPQRYALIRDDILVLYPTLSIAYAIAPWLQLGISGQVVITNFSFTQSLYAGDSLGMNPMNQTAEDPNFDAQVAVNLPGKLTYTAIFGVLSKPTNWLSIGASYRPPIPVSATGEKNANDPKSTEGVSIVLSPLLAKTASVEGSKATLALTLPMELRAGVRITPTSRLGINADFVYQGWQSVDALRLTPSDMYLVVNGVRTAVAPVTIQKNWQASFSGRLGAGFELFRELTLHAGVFYETGASPNSFYSIDFANPSRVFVTGGASVHLGPIDLVGGVSVSPVVTTVVQNGELRRGQTDPTITAGVINSGIYTSGGISGTIGIRGHFLEHGARPQGDAPSLLSMFSKKAE